MNVMEQQITPLIEDLGNHYQIDPPLIKAIIQIESNWEPIAIRFEKGYRWLYEVDRLVKDLRLHRDTEEYGQKVSWGLMQVMGAVARERGYRGRYLSGLLSPELGLLYGVKHLHWSIKRFGGDIWDGVSAYNQGSAKKTVDGSYVNQFYVDKVKKYYEQYRG